METLSIGEVAFRAGIATSTIRYYERLGLLPPAARVNGRRRYSPDVFRSLMLIQLGQSAGFTLSELHALGEAIGEEPGQLEWKSVVDRKLDEVRDRILRWEAAERLLLQGLACDCISLASCAQVREL